MHKRFRRLASLFLKQRRCPFCGWLGFRFEPFGNKMTFRNDAQCPICGSLERHRLAFLLLRPKIPGGQKVLHVAPEPLMIPWLVSVSSDYVNGDLFHPAMMRLDLTDIALPDDSKTLVWCSHVLEHILDDGKALSELFRIIKPGGLLVLQVPIRGKVTYEDRFVVDESDRMKQFLQEDHVRLYGLDLEQRVQASGFRCEILSAANLPPSDRKLYGVDAEFYREVVLCWRPEAS